MVRLLADIIRRGVAPFPASRLTASSSFYQSVLRLSTNVPGDTHEDFRPAIKTESSGVAIKDIVEQDLKENSVMIYMKGVPDLPRCGFSALAVRVLKEHNVPLSSRNILEDLELKNAVKASATGQHSLKYSSMGSSLGDLTSFLACIRPVN
ncbi:monothiol glutaredoxin-S15, mitochondrial-like isoform X1 [Primulina eburnea]|uniref:monothiol glutaredoxin-S15, mitochondrial-like isoform X1 n=1 Tax=Primulina eburnea TaxID=1245227 RepID=UPI003C6BEC71